MQRSPGVSTDAPCATSTACGDLAASRVVQALFESHAAELRRYAQRIVRTRDAAEDVVQEVFLRLWLVRDRVEIGEGIRSYLFISTRARALASVARAQRDARRARGDGADAEWMSVAGGPEPPAGTIGGTEPAGPGDAWEAVDVERAVAHVLIGLPPRQEAVARLRFVERCSTADVARRLGISPRTVEAHVARATRSLRAQLPPEVVAVWAGGRSAGHQ